MMFHPNALHRTPSQTGAFDDACARTRAAAMEHGCPPETLRAFDHSSDADVFFESHGAPGPALFFKSHLGTPAQLGTWSEPASARWAQRAGCGARVLPTQTPGVLVTERLLGRPMTRAEGNQPHFIAQVAQALHRLHHAEPSAPSGPLANATGAARDRIGHALRDGIISPALHGEILAKADWLDAEFAAYTIAPQRRFGDPHAGNWIVVGEHLVAVDLASSRYGDPLADLARYAFCQRFDHSTLQSMLDVYAEADAKPPSAAYRRRLRLHAMAQNLDYFGYFASLQGAKAPPTQDLARRLIADELEEPACPRGSYAEILQAV